jgi:hypothetical protein
MSGKDCQDLPLVTIANGISDSDELTVTIGLTNPNTQSYVSRIDFYSPVFPCLSDGVSRLISQIFSCNFHYKKSTGQGEMSTSPHHVVIHDANPDP